MHQTGNPHGDDLYEGGSGKKPKGTAAGDDKDNRKFLKKLKLSNYEEMERRKRKALYGTRASSKIFESAAVISRRSWG